LPDRDPHPVGCWLGVLLTALAFTAAAILAALGYTALFRAICLACQ
jgi:crotonobetainyl-CoA:carnitine CoA-transferase CaiB-like acyl-CoA transferase